MKPMIERRNVLILGLHQARRRLASEKPLLVQLQPQLLKLARVNSRGRCTTACSAAILFTLSRTKRVKPSRKSSGACRRRRSRP